MSVVHIPDVTYPLFPPELTLGQALFFYHVLRGTSLQLSLDPFLGAPIITVLFKNLLIEMTKYKNSVKKKISPHQVVLQKAMCFKTLYQLSSNLFMNVSVTNHLCFDNFTSHLVLILQFAHVCVCVLHYVCAGTHRAQRTLDPQKLILVVSHLTRVGSFYENRKYC